MGFFDKAIDMAKGALDKTKCLTGFHDLSSWSYEPAKSCVQKRRCKRSGCLETESQTSHDWPAFKYVSEDSCEQQRQCHRCKEREKQTLHASWSEWTYLKPGKCDQSRKCGRCNGVEKTIEHVWEAWNYESPTSCAQVRFCRRCNDKERKEPTEQDHQWGEPIRMNCRFEKIICGHCKKEKTNSLIFAQHVWGQWRQSSLHPDRLERRCSECGERDERDKT